MTVRLSKSKLIAFRQCAKRLWLEVHRPELKVEDASTMGRFASGHRIIKGACRDGDVQETSLVNSDDKNALHSIPGGTFFRQGLGLTVR
jgi:hypothetical protein